MQTLRPIEKQRGGLLAYFLNCDAGKHKDVGHILEGCQELHALTINQPAAVPSPAWRAYELKRFEIGGRINAALRRFPIVLGIEVCTPELSTVSYPAWRGWRTKQKTVLAQMTPTGARVFGMHTALQVILEMTGAGTIDRIRRCENPNCGKWIMAVSAKRLTCSDACRIAKFQMRPGSRANYMRKIRKLHKDNPQLKKQKGRKSHGERKG